MNAGAGAPRVARGSSGSSFHYSFGLLPPDQKRGIRTVYAFCRAIDDLADEAPAGSDAARAGLRLYRDELERCYAGNAAMPLMRDLQTCIARFAIPRRPLFDLLDGVEMDLHKRRYATFDELRVYCERVASAVGLVCLSIFGCREEGSRRYAIDLGIALQLVNILRDLKQDAARGRIYIPLDDMARFAYAEDDLLAGRRTAGFLDLMRHQAARARRHFAAAAAALPSAERPRLLAAEVMAAIYRRLLARIEAGGFRVFDRPVAVPRWTQFSVALRARVTGQVAT